MLGDDSQSLSIVVQLESLEGSDRCLATSLFGLAAESLKGLPADSPLKGLPGDLPLKGLPGDSTLKRLSGDLPM